MARNYLPDIDFANFFHMRVFLLHESPQFCENVSLYKIWLSKNFILWVKILLRDQESCVINGGTTTKYFSLGRDVRQGGPISAFFVCFSFRGLTYSYKIEA